MKTHPTLSFTTEPHSMTHLIHPPVSSFRIRCCCACSFMLSPPPPAKIEQERKRDSEKDTSASWDSKSITHFQIVSATASNSHICAFLSLFYASLLPWSVGAALRGRLTEQKRKIKEGGCGWSWHTARIDKVKSEFKVHGGTSLEGGGVGMGVGWGGGGAGGGEGLVVLGVPVI